MQAVVQETSTTEATNPTRQIAISFEVVAYLALILLAVVLRIAELDNVPLTESEARQALASWRVIHPDAVGSTSLPDSALLFTLHNITFTLLGDSEFSARILTALAGVALALTPLLFREWFGQVRVFILAGLLAFSPTLLVASRFDSPVIWAALLAVWGGWALWRYWQAQRPRHAFIAAGTCAAAAVLTGAGGLLLVLMMAASAIIAVLMTSMDDPDRLDLPDSGAMTLVRTRFAGFPWQTAGIIAAAVVVLVPTVFMIYPAGLSSVSQSLGGLLSGFSTAKPGVLAFSPLVMSLYYEPFLWGFALLGVWLLSRRAAFSVIERFFMVWTILGLIGSVFYAGATPDFAIWIILPLAGLASSAGAALLENDEQYAVRIENDQYFRFRIPNWAKWFIAGAAFGLMVILGAHITSIGRSLLTMPTGVSFTEVLNLMFEKRYVALLQGVIWSLMAGMFLVAGYFMAASYWHPMVAGQGLGLGLLIFGVFTSAGSGWNVAVPNADNAVEPWHMQATGSETFLLRKTLTDLAQRSSGGFFDLPIVVLAPDNGVAAWVVRDFRKTRFITDLNEARLLPVVLLPQPGNDKPDLGGAYVGQRFIISRTWQTQTMQATDWLAWWTQRRARLSPFPLQPMILWVRQDIYDGAQASG